MDAYAAILSLMAMTVRFVGESASISRFRERIEAARNAGPFVSAPSDEGFRAAVIESRKEYHDKLRA